MDHIAILSKKTKLLKKIISGEKTIESRWYKFRKAPFKEISIEDTVYFKDSGEPVSAKAKVDKVLFFDGLNPEKIRNLLIKYGGRLGVGLSYLEQIKDKKFCTLIFIKDVEEIEPFQINKKGYGMMAAWIIVDNVDKIKVLPKII